MNDHNSNSSSLTTVGSRYRLNLLSDTPWTVNDVKTVPINFKDAKEQMGFNNSRVKHGTISFAEIDSVKLWFSQQI